MEKLGNIVEAYGERVLMVMGSERVGYAAFGAMVAARKAALADVGEELATLEMAWSAECFADLVARLELGHSIVFGAAVPNGGLERFADCGALWVMRTGGTTGAARHVVHSVERLLGGYRLEARAPRRVLVLYAADHIAGLDSFFQAMHRGATLVMPRGHGARDIAECIERQRVAVLPATPTLLQFLLLSGELEGRDLDCVEVIPHGAEPMPPVLRARLAAVFRKARCVQRFGMTELGALPVREDGEDATALYLDEGKGYAWEVRAGELWIQAPTRCLGTLEEGLYAEGAGAWHPTGDLAEKTPRGSVRILGRRSALINVGGEKVIPEAVEAYIMAQPGVRDVAVTGVTHPLTGQAVRAQVIVESGVDVMALRRGLRAAARARGLSLAHVPTQIEVVERIEKTAVGKRGRS